MNFDGSAKKDEASYDLVRHMRASILVLGPLLVSKGSAKVPLQGGCAIGTRPIDLHVMVMETLGANVFYDSGFIIASLGPDGLKGGVINFSSIGNGASVVVEYVSDGMENGEDGSISVNKLFEEYLYAYVKYSLLNGRLGVQEYIVNRARKDKSSLLRNAKIRLSNIHPGRLLMSLRGQDKWLK